MLRIRVERKRRSWRIEDLSFYSRVPGAEISRIETGRTLPYPKHAAALAKALGLQVDELLQEVKDTSPEPISQGAAL